MELLPWPDELYTYWQEWTHWYDSLSSYEQRAYKAQYPEPDGWEDFYDQSW